MNPKFLQHIIFIILLTSCQTYNYNGIEYETAELRKEAILRDEEEKLKRLKEKKLAEEKEKQLLLEKAQQEEDEKKLEENRKKAFGNLAPNFNILEESIDKWFALIKGEEELYNAGQSIKAQKKNTEREKERAKIEKILSNTQTITVTNKCPFVRVLKEYGDGYDPSRFQLSCFKTWLLDQENKYNSIFELTFDFAGDSARQQDEKTNESLIEQFEESRGFIGTIQILKKLKIRNSFNNIYYIDGVRIPLRPYPDSFDSQRSIKVKILNLKPYDLKD